VTALAATALNPLTVALWTVSFPAAAPDAASESAPHAAALLAGVAVGTLAWYCAFSGAVAAARRRLGGRLLSAMDVVTGFGLMVFGALLGHRAVAGER
jgi:putative LysE/RhtB family amino acid efflux pump